MSSHLAQELHMVDTTLPELTNIVSITPWIRADYTRPPVRTYTIIKGKPLPNYTENYLIIG